MKIVVCLKQTFDTEAKIELDSQGKISAQGVQLIINPYDEFAVEEALRLKENLGGEVAVVSVGSITEEALRQALAMGADRAVLVQDAALAEADSGAVARVLAAAVGQMEYDLILAGQTAIDDGAGQVAARLAERLGLPQANVVTKLEVDGGKAQAHREADGGTEVLEVSLPALITAQKGLNEPRYPSLKGVMAAKKKELKTLSLADLGLSAGDIAPQVKVKSLALPAARKGGKVLGGEPAEAAKELVRCLREEAKVI